MLRVLSAGVLRVLGVLGVLDGLSVFVAADTARAGKAGIRRALVAHLEKDGHRIDVPAVVSVLASA